MTTPPQIGFVFDADPDPARCSHDGGKCPKDGAPHYCGLVPDHEGDHAGRYCNCLWAQLSERDVFEWQDPETDKRHKCPRRYVVGLLAVIRVGRENARPVEELLRLMGEKPNAPNARHFRRAALYLKQNGVHCISYRSSKGGYFIAQTPDEVAAYSDQERTFAAAMVQDLPLLERTSIDDSHAALAKIKTRLLGNHKSI